MKIKKSGLLGSAEVSGAEEMELINGFTRRALGRDEVYTFSLILCDNEVDRDLERFDEKTLFELKELFLGKTGISDHRWSAENQVARIYRTEILKDEKKKTTAGEPLISLKAWAYMLRTEGNGELIAQIDGGIRRETSVGCSVSECVCSICGKPLGSPECGHAKGQSYGGKVCHGILHGAVDAYEWSFVAVPAQKNAGVTKALDLSKGLRGLVESEKGRELLPEYQLLAKEAALGRKYMAGLKAEVKRLALIGDRQLHDSLKDSFDSMEEDTLLGLKAVFEKKAAEKYPIFTQLPARDENAGFDGGEYLI